jgi:phosphate starvation-inducible PhoH-like protein
MSVLQSDKPIIIATGPAGSGKTMFACQVASEKIKTREYSKLILTRPIVAADEDMGYLPGEVERKMEPWTKPMIEIFEKYLTRGEMNARVSIEPLGFMRGRTFDNSYIIADEMQNSTVNQMKMLLTRIGENTKIIVTGDVEQSDLGLEDNGLYDLLYRIGDDELEYSERVQMTNDDIVRHPAINELLEYY